MNAAAAPKSDGMNKLEGMALSAILLGFSFGEKLAQWRMRPTASLQLLTTVLMLAVLILSVR